MRILDQLLATILIPAILLSLFRIGRFTLPVKPCS